MQVFCLKPTLETYIVSKEPVPEQGYEELEEDIQILTVEFNQSKMEPIINALMNQENKRLWPFVK